MQTISDIIDEIKTRKLNVSKIARELDIPVSRFHKWIRKENLPKTEDDILLREWADKYLEFSPNSKSGMMVNEDAPPYGKNINTTKSVENLSESVLQLSKANKSLTDINSALTNALISVKIKK